MANKFVEMLEAPKVGDKYFTHYENGGISICFKIDKVTGWCLPNCIGLAHGLFLKYDYPDSKNAVWSVPACNAEDWFAVAQKNNYKVGSEPKLGAVACYVSGKTQNSADGCGHVAVVQKIYDTGDCLVAESYYNGAEFGLTTIKKENKYSWNGLTLLGFIYPHTEFEQVITPTAKQNTPEEDYSMNTIPNRFKVKVTENGGKSWKQIGAYTVYDNAKRSADKSGGVVIDGNTGSQIYPEIKTVTAKPAIRTGAKFTLKNTQVYSNQNGRTDGFRNGTYYVWNATPFNGYIRMTNKESRVEVPGQVSFWCKASDLEAML